MSTFDWLLRDGDGRGRDLDGRLDEGFDEVWRDFYATTPANFGADLRDRPWATASAAVLTSALVVAATGVIVVIAAPTLMSAWSRGLLALAQGLAR